MVTIKSTLVRSIGASAYTVCPFCFIDPLCAKNESILKHEKVHWNQQFHFGLAFAFVGIFIWLILGWPPQWMSLLLVLQGFIEGWVLGQFLWRALYLFVLPTGWNPFRRRWETQAYRANGFSDTEIDGILAEPPYYLSPRKK